MLKCVLKIETQRPKHKHTNYIIIHREDTNTQNIHPIPQMNKNGNDLFFVELEVLIKASNSTIKLTVISGNHQNDLVDKIAIDCDHYNFALFGYISFFSVRFCVSSMEQTTVSRNNNKMC